MEAIVYEKLEAYSKYVPGAIFQRWQPTHALKVLLQFEPGADETVRVRIAKESQYGVPSAGPWTTLGDHKTLKLGWLAKEYNRLGNYLHVPHGSQATPPNAAQQKTELIRIAKGLEDVLNSSIVAITLAERVGFACQVCGQANLANAEGVRKTGQAFCINPSCGLVYHAIEDQGGWKLVPEVSNFSCRDCGAAIALPNNRLTIGLEFKCGSCGSVHIIVERQWGYATKAQMSRQEQDGATGRKAATKDQRIDTGPASR